MLRAAICMSDQSVIILICYTCSDVIRLFRPSREGKLLLGLVFMSRKSPQTCLCLEMNEAFDKVLNLL